MSKELLIQMLGRGTRQHPGKDDCLLLDYAGNLECHSPLEEVAETRKTQERERQDKEREDEAKEEREEQERRARHYTSVLRETQEYAVMRITSRVVPSKRHPGKSLLEVSYLCPARAEGPWVKQWLCVEYEGFPRQQAEAWFSRRSLTCPRTAQHAQVLLRDAVIPARVLLGRDGQWTRVVMEYFGEGE